MLDAPEISEKIDFEEFRTLDLKIKNSVLTLRKNLSVDSKDLDAQINQLKEMINIITDINKNNPELKKSISNINLYYKNKSDTLIKFKMTIADLYNSIQTLKLDYSQLHKSNKKIFLEKMESYNTYIIDALFFLSISNKENEIKLFEDINILGETIKGLPNPDIFLIDFNNHINNIYHRTSEINIILETFLADFSFNDDLQVIGQSYEKIRLTKERNEETIIKLLYTVIVCYLIILVIILRKRR